MLLVLWSTIMQQFYLHCVASVSVFCRDCLIVVSWPKHVVQMKLKSCETKTKKIFTFCKLFKVGSATTKNTHSSLFFIIKPTRCTNFMNLFCHETLHVSDSSSVHHQEFIHCTISNGLWSYLPIYEISVWHIPLLSVQWINSWWWTEELCETCRVSRQNKFVKLVHLVGFNTKIFVTMHGHMIVKKFSISCLDMVLETEYLRNRRAHIRVEAELKCVCCLMAWQRKGKRHINKREYWMGGNIWQGGHEIHTAVCHNKMKEYEQR
jgi:hypothetical protein